MIKASVIVINWNGEAFLKSCLTALLTEIGYQDEILVVDNNSTDKSVELLCSHFPDVELICSSHNLGYAGGANVGMEAARGDVLVLLNPDVRVHKGWMDELKDALQDQRVGVVGCKLLYPGGERIQHAGGVIDWPTAQPNHRGYGQNDEGQWDCRGDVDYVTGAALALRRTMLDRVGFFDEGFYPAYFEEVDYCTRVRRAGYRVLYVPKAVATHFEHASLETRSYRYHRLFHRNRLRFLLKHLAPLKFVGASAAAERELLARDIPLNERGGLAGAYLEAIVAYPTLFRHHWADEGKKSIDQMDAVLKALSDLRAKVWKAAGDGGVER